MRNRPLRFLRSRYPVPRAGAKMLVKGGDYCVFICGQNVVKNQKSINFDSQSI